MKEKTVKVPLTLMESGTLCHLMMRAFHDSKMPLEQQPQWLLDLYEKLAEANDKLMRKKS